MENKIPHGVIDDPRPVVKKIQDHLHEERYGGLPVVWIEKPQSTWKLTPQRNQDGSFSCYMQSAASAIYTFLKQEFSALPYQLRAGGKGSEGMYGQNVGDILFNIGTCLESIGLSEYRSDPQIDSAVLPPASVKITGYRTFSSLNIDSIAEATQAYGNCIITIASNSQEYLVTPVYLGTPVTFGHAICASDFTLINGVKTLVCNDSAGQFSSPTGLRLITEDFLNKRGKQGLYFLGVTTTMLSPTLSVDVWKQFVAFLKSIGKLVGGIIKK